MKRLFKRIERDSVPKCHLLSKGIQAGYRRVQGGWANWMMKHTEKFSRRTWVVLVILFVASIGTYDVYLIVSSITTKGRGSFSVTPIQKPEHLTETGEVRKAVPDTPYVVEYTRIKGFRIYMDSLARSPAGKTLYDSITRWRPGLMDSLWFIENYHGQLNQK